MSRIRVPSKFTKRSSPVVFASSSQNLTTLRAESDFTSSNTTPGEMNTMSGLESDSLDIHVKNARESGDYSDLTLKCGSEIFLVHKLVVSRSSFFAKAIKSGFKEGKTGEIDFPDDCPEVLRAVLLFLYEGNMNDIDRVTHDAEGIVFVVKLYAAAEKYMLGKLKENAISMFRYVIEHHFEVPPTDPLFSPLEPRFRYMLRDDDFLVAITAVYEAELVDIGPLRTIVMRRATIDANLSFGDENGKEFLRNNPSFAIDLTVNLSLMLLEERKQMKRMFAKIQADQSTTATKRRRTGEA